MKLGLFKDSYEVIGSESIEFYNKKKFMKDCPKFKIKYNIKKS